MSSSRHHIWVKGRARPLNIKKAKFAAKVFGADIKFVENEIEHFLVNSNKTYDVVLFMGILYHLLDPFNIMKHVGEKTNRLIILETVVSIPKLNGFENNSIYCPTDAAFFLRIDSNQSHTAGLNNMELWPNSKAVHALFNHAGFQDVTELFGESPLPEYFADSSRKIYSARKTHVETEEQP